MIVFLCLMFFEVSSLYLGVGCCTFCVVYWIEQAAFSQAFCCSYRHAPIHLAVKGGHLSCLKFLVSKNADVNALEECVLLLLLLMMIVKSYISFLC